MRAFSALFGSGVAKGGGISIVALPIARFRQTPLRWRIGILVLLVVLLAGLFAGIFFIPKPTSKDFFDTWGYPGVFIVTLIANSSVIIPTPGFLAVIAAGAVLNPFLVALTGAAGMTLGELSGYFIGRGGRALSAGEPEAGSKGQHRWIAATQRFVDRWGMLGIAVLAATPNPLFDIAGIAAGAAKMGISRFLLATFIGRMIRTLLLAYGSAYSVKGITDIFT
ncbi:MAG: YqaA family protein [Dehalococcoidia bacterium]